MVTRGCFSRPSEMGVARASCAVGGESLFAASGVCAGFRMWMGVMRCWCHSACIGVNARPSLGLNDAMMCGAWTKGL